MAPKRKQSDGQSPTSATRGAARTTVRATRAAVGRREAALKKPLDDPEPRKRRKGSAVTAPSTSSASAAASSTVVIEYSKQDSLFKKRATEVKNGLKKALPGLKVSMNPQQPRRGCFEIRDEADANLVFLSLLDMKSPFNPLKQLDTEKVISDLVDRFG